MLEPKNDLDDMHYHDSDDQEYEVDKENKNPLSNH